jgi:hypothetical protein
MQWKEVIKAAWKNKKWSQLDFAAVNSCIYNQELLGGNYGVPCSVIIYKRKDSTNKKA